MLTGGEGSWKWRETTILRGDVWTGGRRGRKGWRVRTRHRKKDTEEFFVSGSVMDSSLLVGQSDPITFSVLDSSLDLNGE